MTCASLAGLVLCFIACFIYLWSLLKSCRLHSHVTVSVKDTSCQPVCLPLWSLHGARSITSRVNSFLLIRVGALWRGMTPLFARSVGRPHLFHLVRQLASYGLAALSDQWPLHGFRLIGSLPGTRSILTSWRHYTITFSCSSELLTSMTSCIFFVVVNSSFVLRFAGNRRTSSRTSLCL